MSRIIKIDFVSDIACPWCALGFASLEKAVENLGPDFNVEIRCHPFELNPHMPVGGEEIFEHLQAKYRATPEQVRASQLKFLSRGLAVGLDFNNRCGQRIYNTFTAHRLLLWAGEEADDDTAQRRLKKELLTTYFTLNASLDDHENLLDAVSRAGLDVERAREILETNAFAEEVCAEETFYAQAGITAIPAIIFNDTHLIEGAQPVERFETALKQFSMAE